MYFKDKNYSGKWEWQREKHSSDHWYHHHLWKSTGKWDGFAQISRICHLLVTPQSLGLSWDSGMNLADYLHSNTLKTIPRKWSRSVNSSQGSSLTLSRLHLPLFTTQPTSCGESWLPPLLIVLISVFTEMQLGWPRTLRGKGHLNSPPDSPVLVEQHSPHCSLSFFSRTRKKKKKSLKIWIYWKAGVNSTFIYSWHRN